MLKYCCVFVAAFTLAGFETADQGLKDYYKSYFPVGVAVSQRILTGDEARLIKKEFSSVTPENAMKMGPIHPLPDVYNFREPDSIVAFARRNGIRVRGHALCWHEQTPAWLFKNADGSQVSKEELLNRLRSHITTVVNRYRGKVYAWDVVNEAIDDNPANFLRESLWYKICGEEFIAKAFEYAHAADPAAQLFYNDYNTERPEKRERVYRLLKKLVDAGVPINGVGLQAHWSLYEPGAGELKTALEKYSSLGLQIQITELDISVYPWEKEKRALQPGENKGFTREMDLKQAARYREVFKIFRQYKQHITGVTFWNLSDGYTWLDTYPVPGRKNYPLLFDKDLKRKTAYKAVTKF
ncbi:endo-1,4-beta-xylanase [Hufsiella ginkgonis]|uniref:Beta-xylanase n=1 Tax=Hufsiella ginkgonis TaxID=2695274 RepID=A0A7K1Y0F4_9SPHI|nr:endo-1,4-beta-xylanase [Hufsiella ginkgonis]MXV16710.1 1,4-beta-xylanase [Hufsiella ginkgonis]